MIDYINKNYSDIDTLIVGRGGGSAEDLWAFNEEIVARSIYDSAIPVISAVGHEIDFTIADFVADRRAETPTAAAQMAVPDTEEIRKTLYDKRENLYLQLVNKVRLSRLGLDNVLSEMKNSLTGLIFEKRHQIEQLKLMLEKSNPEKVLEEGYAVLTDKEGKTVSSAHDLVKDRIYRILLKDGSADCNIIEVKDR